MAALLVTLAIMTILLSVAMPVWRHQAQREKEAELVFRGEQYARAIALFRFKNANLPNALPPSIDFLVENRFLRKKYKDPMTKDGEFMPLQFGSQQPGIPGAGANQPGGTPPGPGRGITPPGPGRGITPPGAGRSTTSPQPTGPGQVAGGISGVRSKSEETSIRAYRGATRYDQWLFQFNVAPRPGGAMPATNTPDGRGNTPPGAFPGSGPGQRGGPQRGNPPGQRGGPGVGPGGAPPPVFTPGGNRGVTPGGRGRGL